MNTSPHSSQIGRVIRLRDVFISVLSPDMRTYGICNRLLLGSILVGTCNSAVYCGYGSGGIALVCVLFLYDVAAF